VAESDKGHLALGIGFPDYGVGTLVFETGSLRVLEALKVVESLAGDRLVMPNLDFKIRELRSGRHFTLSWRERGSKLTVGIGYRRIEIRGPASASALRRLVESVLAGRDSGSESATAALLAG